MTSIVKSTARVEIREVAGRRDLDKFIRVPWPIYAHDPQWVPPLLVDVKEFLDRKRHPFYLHGEATQFLALQDGKPVGRVLASDDPHFNQQHGTNLGAFGMFESIQDQGVAHALLDAAAAWLAAAGALRSAVRSTIRPTTSAAC